MLTKKNVPVDFGALGDAFENNAPTVHSFLHLITGDVIRIVDGHADPEMYQKLSCSPNCIRIPPVSSREQHDWLEKFASMVDDIQLGEALKNAIVGKGSFRRFKDILASRDAERNSWISFRRERLRRVIDCWLSENGITPVQRTKTDTSHERIASFVLEMSPSDLIETLKIVASKRCFGCGADKPCTCPRKKGVVNGAVKASTKIA